jgi:peptide/nickel transport system substrate-binding protein
VNVSTIDVIDDHTLRINMSSWDGLMVNYFSLKAAQMYSPTAVQTYGEDWAVTHPVGTGPFKFADYEQDVFLKFERFDDYWQEGKPYLDSIEWVYIADPTTAKASFLAGEAHLIAGLTAVDANDLKETGDYEVRFNSPSTCFCLQTDSKNADSPWSDLKVRQAMSHAIDNEAICDALGYGFYQATNQIGYPGYTMYNPDIVGYPYDPEKAKALLAEAGYPDGFETTIYHSTGAFDNIFLAVQQYLNDVGIRAEIELVEMGRAFEISTGGWHNGIQTTIPPYFAVGYPPAKMCTFYFATNSVFSVSRMLPDEIEELTLKALNRATAEERWKDTQEINRLIIDKYCLVHPMFIDPNICALVPELHDDRIFDPWKEVWRPADAWLEK